MMLYKFTIACPETIVTSLCPIEDEADADDDDDEGDERLGADATVDD